MFTRTFMVPMLIIASLCVSTGYADPPVTQDLLLWLDAEQGVTTDPNGHVTIWADFGPTGGANDAAQAIAEDRPLLTTGGPLGNRQVIDFQDRTLISQPIDDYLEIGSNSAFDFTDCAWFVVFRSDNGYDGTLIRSSYDSLGPGGSTSDAALANVWGSYLSTVGDDGVRSHFRELDGGFAADSVGVGDPSQFNIMSVVRDGVFVDRWVVDPNGVESALVSTFGTDSSPSGHRFTRIGASSLSDLDPTQFFAGDIAEVLVYSAAPSTADRQAIQQYLYDKWYTGSNPTLSVTSDLLVWLRADAGVIADSNSRVSTWGDQAALGGANDAVQTVSTAQPVLVENASPLGDLPVIRFAGDHFEPPPVDDYLEIGPSSALDFESCAWFMVFNSANGYDGTLIRSSYDSLDPNDPNSSTSDSDLANVWGTYLSTAGDDGARSHFRGADGSFNAESVGVSDISQLHIMSAVRDGTNLDRWIIDPNGVVTQSVTTTGIDSRPSGHRFTRIGASSLNDLAPTQFFAGDIAEVLVYSVAPSTADRQAIEQYLYDKWYTGSSPSLPVTSDLVVWLRADAGVVAGPDRRVSTWLDQAAFGGANDAAQAVVTARPFLVANASPLGDLPVIRFAADNFSQPGAGEYLDVPGDSAFDADTFTWFMVANTNRPYAIAAENLVRSAYTDGGGGDAVAWGTFRSDLNGGGPRSHARAADGSFVGVSAAPANLNEYFIFSTRWDSANNVDTWYTDPNGTTMLGPDSPGTGADAVPTGHLFTRLGAGISDSLAPVDFLTGSIGEVLVYSRDLSDADRIAIEQYLYEKWFTYPADVDGDGDVDFDDLSLLATCLNGPGVSIPPGGCSVDEFADADLDDDGDCDLADIAKFAIEFPAP